MKNISDTKHRLSRCQERVSQLETVLEISSLLNTELDLDILLDKIMQTARNVMDADIVSFALIDEERGDLVFKLAVGKKGNLIPGLGKLSRVPLGEGINGTVAQTGKALMLEDCRHHPTFNPGYEKIIGMGFGPILAAPIKVKGNILGSCSVIRDRARQLFFSNKDLSLFNMFCDSAGLAVHNARTHQAVLRNQKLETNMAFSQSVQESFLPAQAPRRTGFRFAAKMVPAQTVGGDYYDFIDFPDGTLGIILGDVSGKGFAAALHMARLMSDFRNISQTISEPAAIFNEVNRLLYTRSRRQAMFTTAIFLLLDPVTRRVRIANAGHPPLLLKKASGKLLEKGKADGPPLGILPKISYTQSEIRMDKGDAILLYSDGILDARDEKRQLYGSRRLKRTLKSSSAVPRKMIQDLQKSVRQFSKNAEQADDLTFVSLLAI